LRAAAQHVLPHRQGAGDAEHGFRGDEADGAQMQVAEPGVADPAPSQRRADPDQQQPADDEGDDAEVNDD
jgi:hypothetical protein